MLIIFLPVLSFCQEISLQNLIDESIKNNPQIKVKKEIIDVLKIRVQKSASLEEPKIGFGLTNVPTNSFSLIDEDMTMTELKLMQMFPFPGKLSLRESIANYNLQIAEEEYKEKVNEIKAQIKKSYYELFFLDKAISITNQNKLILRSFIDITSAKYKAEAGLKSDILRANVEVSKMSSELLMLAQKKETAKAKLNALLYSSVEIPVEDLEIKKTTTVLEFEKLKDIAIKLNPILKSLELKLEQNKVMRELSTKELLPDFDLGISYGIRGGSPTGMQRSNTLSFMVSLNLPFLWGKAGYEVKENEIESKVISSEYDNVKNEIFFMIKDSLAEIQKSRSNLELYETIVIPQAKENVESAVANYRSNKIDFLTMLDSQMTLYKYEIELLKELVEHESKIAELERIIGGEIK